MSAAADYLEAADLLEEAIGQAVTAGSTERAIRLLERQARRTYESGELTTLLGWLDALPARPGGLKPGARLPPGGGLLLRRPRRGRGANLRRG